MQPIRVLHVVTYMGRGGLETMLMNYYRHIDRDKIQFDFLVHRDFEAAYDREIQELGGRIYRLPFLNPFSPTYLQLLDVFFEEHREYRIVHSHLDCMAGIPLKYANKHGVSLRIAHAHSSSQSKDSKYWLKLWFKRQIPKYATVCMACSDAAGAWMFGANCFMVLNNAIDTANYRFDPIVAKTVRKMWKIPNDAVVLGHVGRFMDPKNHVFLLEVFAEIVKRQPQAYLLLVGDGELRRLIENKIQKLGLADRVVMTGVREDVHKLLQAMDVFVFPSLYEGLPLSVVEAQAAGLPCLISDKVPIECKKTNLVQQLSLEENASVWADRVLSMIGAARRDTSQEIMDAGFDIAQNAKWLQQFYLDAYSAG